MSNTISDDYKNKIVEDYRNNIQTIRTLSNKYNVSIPTIYKIFNQYNISQYTKQQICSAGLNENIFENIDSEEKAYFLGFFLADGCVFYPKNKSTPKIIFGTNNQDSYIVEKFHNILHANTSLRIDKRDNFVTCVVSSNKIASDLNFFSIDKPKYVRPLPIVRYDLLNHLLRGFFDGDGCITYSLSHPKRNICNSYSGKVNFVAYEIIKDDLLYILYNIIGISHVLVNKANSNVTLFSLDIRRKDDIMKFYNYIYNNASVYLIRKRDKFENYFKDNHMI